MIIDLVFSTLELIDCLLEYIIVTNRKYKFDYIIVYLR
jgi:hypothetical protein